MAGEFDWLLGNDSSGKVGFADARRKRLEEEKRNLAKRGRGFSTGATPTDVAMLEDDIDTDPDFGIEQQKQVSDTNKRLASESAFMSPGATDVRQQTADEKLKAMLGLEHGKTDEAIRLEKTKQELPLALNKQKQQFQEQYLGSQAPNEEGGHGFVPSFNANGDMTLKGIAPHKPTTEEQRALDTMGSLAALGPEMLKMYQTQYPGIEAPGGVEKYGGPGSVLGAMLGAGAYKTGYVGDSKSDQLTQLTGYLEAVLPRMLSSGRINREQYADLKLHVPQVGLSAGANYGRASYVMNRLLPRVHASIGTAPGSFTPTEDLSNDPLWGSAIAAQADPYSNPNWGR